MRDKTIAVSETEKSLLEQAAQELTGTTDMAYGAVLTMLVHEATNVDTEAK